MLGSEERRRVRPGPKGLGLSLFVVATASYLEVAVFGVQVYLPLTASLAFALAATAFRRRRLNESLPQPYGRGRTTELDARAALRSGLFVIAGSFALMGLILGGAFVLPPVEYFVLVFGVCAGLPLSEVLYFAVVARTEKRLEARLYLVSEDAVRDGREVLVKSVVLE